MKRELSVSIGGMSCVNCSNSIESYLGSENGVCEVSVNFAAGRGRIVYDDSAVGPGRLAEMIAELGFTVSSMEEPSRSLRGPVVHSNGGVAGNAAAGDADDVSHNVKTAGTMPAPGASEPAGSAAGTAPGHGIREGAAVAVALAFGVPVFVLNMFFCHLPWSPPAMALLSLPVLLHSGARFHRNAFVTLGKRLPLTMDALVSASSSASYLLSLFLYLVKGSHEVYFDSATSIIAIILVGKTIEERIRARARTDMAGIIEGMPEECVVRASGAERRVTLREVSAGDVVVALPRSRVPVDGEILSGAGFIENSAITGESAPVYVRPGDRIYAGAFNKDTLFEIKALASGNDSYINRIEETLEAALSKKASVQRVADAISARFVPAVFALSATTFAWHFLSVSAGLERAAVSAISVIAIACPCALGLALPVALMFGAGNGARRGMLFADPDALGKMGRVGAVVFDKTGTLTLNRLEVAACEASNGLELPFSELLSLCASVERYSEHPAARAIMAFAASSGVGTGLAVEGYETHAGSGVSAVCAGRRVVIGSSSLAGAAGRFEGFLAKHSAGSHAFVSVDGVPAACFVMEETLAEGAAEALSELSRRGVSAYLLTGDRAEAAAEVAARVGIEPSRVTSGVRPHEKAEFIDGLKAASPGLTVAMVGDGINDSLAMARADVAVAMADATTIARAAASVIMTGGGLRNVVAALDLGARMHRVILQNFFWAFAYNVILIPSAMAGKLDPMQASAAMIFSSLLVVINSTRLGKA